MVSVSSCHDGSNHPLIDALEVYARPRPSGTESMPHPASSGGAPIAPSAAALSTVEALGACSRSLSYALGLATTFPDDKDSVDGEFSDGDEATSPDIIVMRDFLRRNPSRPRQRWLRLLEASAISVLRKTCLVVAGAARCRALRASSRCLLIAVQPDATERSKHVDFACAVEAGLALMSMNERAGEGPVSPVDLVRVARLCNRIYAGRRGCYGPPYAAYVDDRPPVSDTFVFPVLVRMFWESCVWRRRGRESMPVVLRCVLRLAVTEMQKEGKAVDTVEHPTGLDISCDEGTKEDVLRAGLSHIMPLLRSSVTRVSHACGSILTCLLLGDVSGATAALDSSSSSPLVGKRRVEGSVAASFLADGDCVPESAAAESVSETEGRMEIEVTSDPGSDSDADADGGDHSGDVGVGGEASGQERGDDLLLGYAELRARQLNRDGVLQQGHDSDAGDKEGGGAGNASTERHAVPPSLDRALELGSAPPVSSFGGLLPTSARKKARYLKAALSSLSSASAGLNAGRGNAPSGRGAGESDEGAPAAAQMANNMPAQDSSSSSGDGSSRGASVAATAAAAAAPNRICFRFRCDGCDVFPVQHVRHHCLVCADFDLCPQCYEVFHGPSSQFQGGNAVMLGGHNTSHEMVALQVKKTDSRACGS